MNLIDTHCHLIHEQFKSDLPEVIARAKAVGFKSILVSGINPPTNREVLELVKKYTICKASLGIYPIDALGLAPDESGLARHTGKIDIDKEFEFFNKNKDKITAIGEVGMDYKFGADYKEQQKTNFQKIINHTEKLNKPIIVHTRKAEEDCVSILETSKLKSIILHSFEARKSLIKRAADRGFYFSVPTVVVRAQQFQTLVEIVPLTQIFTETDAPWLSPFKDKRNEPAFITESIKKIAEIKHLPEQEVADQIFKNFQNVFGEQP
jgi:TatD DNase family protein